MSLSPRSFVSSTLRRPVTVFMVFCTTLLIGLIASREMPLELLPSGFVNTSVSISIPVPDANPNEVEEQVTRPTVETLRQISGVDEITTSSSKNRARINISFGRSRDPDEAFAEVRDLMEIAKLSWPEEVQEYFTFRFNLDTDLPIFSFGIMIDEYDDDTTFLVDEKVIKEIEAIDGVARVQVWGLVDDTVRIWIDRDRARARGISIYEVAQQLSQDNVDVAGGRIRDGGRDFYLRSRGRFESLDELRDYPIRPGLTLSDVAEVGTALSLRNFVFRLNDKRALWLNVNKEATANTVELSERIKAKLNGKIMRDPRLAEKGWEWFTPELRNVGFVVTNALETLVSSASIGALLAVLPLLFFLRRLRPTIIITLAIPASLLITLGTIYFTGGTMNILSMLGITIAVGMLVDNSIVVVENIFRHRRLGSSSWRAALQGTSEVALAITLATLTTVAAFVPLIFMNKNAEASFFTKGIGLPVCYAVLASLFVALFFIPLTTVLLGRLSGGSRRESLRSRETDEAAAPNLVRRVASVLVWPLDRLYDFIVGTIGRGLELALRFRFLAIVFGVLLPIAVTVPLFGKMGKSGFGDESGGHLSVNVDLESNFTLKDSDAVFKQITQSLETVREEVGIDYTFHGFSRTGGFYNIGMLDKGADHAKSATKVVREAMPEIPGVNIQVGIERQNDERTALKVRIWGEDVDTLERIGEDLRQRIEKVEEVESVKANVEAISDEIVVEPDRERMQTLGVDPRAFFGSIQYGIRGQRLPDFQADERKIPMIIEYDDRAAPSAVDLLGTEVWSRRGTMLPMSSLAKVSYRKGYGTIRKVNGKSSVELKIDTNTDDREGLSARLRETLSAYDMPDGYSMSNESSEDFARDINEMSLTMLLSCVLVAILMGILFESFHLPLAILPSIIFGMIGAVWFLHLTDTSLDMLGLIGGVVLVGIVINNGIVLLDGAHRLRMRGVPRHEALIRAGKVRVRPILMTAATTVVGLLPMAVVDNPGSFVSYKALARGVMGGLIVSTFSTLLLVPVFYTLLDDLAMWMKRLAGVLAGRSHHESDAPSDLAPSLGASPEA